MKQLEIGLCSLCKTRETLNIIILLACNKENISNLFINTCTCVAYKMDFNIKHLFGVGCT